MINHNGFLLVDVPEGFFGYSIIQGYSESFVKISDRVGDYTTRIIPKGNYSIIGLGKDLTEEQWKTIVDSWDEVSMFDDVTTKYENYEFKAGFYYTSTESGDSLLKANNLNPNTTLILKKIL